MSDVPFMAASTLSGLFYLRALKSGRSHDMAWGTLLAVVAFGVRQFGVLISVSYIAVMIWQTRGKGITRKHVCALVLPWLACGALMLYGNMTSEPAYPWTIIMGGIPLPVRMLLTIRHGFLALLYLGLFLLPLTLPKLGLLFMGQESWSLRRWICFGVSVLLVDVIACAGWLLPLPNLPNIMQHIGTGPLTLTDTYAQIAPCLVEPTSIAWWCITFLSIASAAMLVTSLFFRDMGRDTPPITREGSSPEASQKLFLVVWALCIAGAPHNPFLPVMFDRYLLPAVVPVCILLSVSFAFTRYRATSIIATCICLVMGAYAIACTQDYLAWNRARWVAIDRLLVEHKVDPLQIDGGFEYNGARTSDVYMARNNTTDFNNMGALGWWILDDTYAVSFRPREGYEELGLVHYFSFLGLEQRSLRLLHRISPE
jgi:hypothetical protein